MTILPLYPNPRNKLDKFSFSPPLVPRPRLTDLSADFVTSDLDDLRAEFNVEHRSLASRIRRLELKVLSGSVDDEHKRSSDAVVVDIIIRKRELERSVAVAAEKKGSTWSPSDAFPIDLDRAIDLRNGLFNAIDIAFNFNLDIALDLARALELADSLVRRLERKRVCGGSE